MKNPKNWILCFAGMVLLAVCPIALYGTPSSNTIGTEVDDAVASQLEGGDCGYIHVFKCGTKPWSISCRAKNVTVASNLPQHWGKIGTNKYCGYTSDNGFTWTCKNYFTAKQCTEGS